VSKFNLINIDTSFESYQQLINLYNENKDRQFETHFNDISPNILTIIQKNDFLSHFGYKRVTDINNTTIRYLKLKPSDGRYFHRYVLKELLDRPELSIMSSALKRKIAESIYEMFVNAQIHSESDFIYTCGQFFPTKYTIEFTITDTGVGFRKRVNSRFEKKLSSVQAIEWAMKDGHSTKQGISGGIGLAILNYFQALSQAQL
jgi:anti-sigma regulatory factor (Ser/Thr protein kinase)